MVYDDHMASLRREAYERVIEEEAERQAREIEKFRYRLKELLTVAYQQAMECLEVDDDWVRDKLRAQDMIRIMGLHRDAGKAFEVDREESTTGEDDWTEEEEASDQILKETDALPHLEHPDSGLEDKEGSEEGSGEECFSRKAKVKNPSTHQVLEPEARAH
jgi:hypothetical protein